MEFKPLKPHPNVTTNVVCKSGFEPLVVSSTPDKNYPYINSSFSQGQFECVGKRADPDVADPSLYEVHFVYNGQPLKACESGLPFIQK